MFDNTYCIVYIVYVKKRIKIIGCSSENYWYRTHIGVVYIVREDTRILYNESKLYFIVDGYEKDRGIVITDCMEVDYMKPIFDTIKKVEL